MWGDEMRILIVSDTHRKDSAFFKVLKREAPLDMVIHCGDVEGSEELIRSTAAAAGCAVYMVTGNNDFFSDLPREIECEIGKYRVWITHGHNYYVSMGNERIRQAAGRRGADIVMYGHTHKPVVDWGGDVIAVNPGSLSYPRQYDRRPSYIVMELDEAGEAHFHIRYV